MTEKLIKQLEDLLIDLGEDGKWLNQLHETYKSEYSEKTYAPKYISHLKELQKKYYGGVE